MEKDTSIKITGLVLTITLTILAILVYVPLNTQQAPQQTKPIAQSEQDSEEFENSSKDWEFNDYIATGWREYANDLHKISIEYPEHFVYDENAIDQVAFSVEFGLPYEEVFKKVHSARKAAPSFQIIVREKGGISLEEVMQEDKETRGALEKRTESVGTVAISGFPGQQIRACDISNVCEDIYYFTDGKSIYQIIDNPVIGKKMDRSNFERMLDSLKIN